MNSARPSFCASLLVMIVLLPPIPVSRAAPPVTAREGGPTLGETIEVEVRLRSGGRLRGLVVDHNEDALIVVANQTPYAFGWDELESGSAYAVRSSLMAFARGGEKNLSAEDHLALGEFALRFDRNDLAPTPFRKAIAMDRSLEPRIRDAYDQFRETHRSRPGGGDRPLAEPVDEIEPSKSSTGPETGRRPDWTEQIAVGGPDEAVRAKVLEAYRTFGAKVQEILVGDIALVETDHFLIWTDWAPRDRPRLAEWSEQMYATLCREFGLDLDQQVFLAKCPIFCWRSKVRFVKFARHFDGYDGKNAVGYTRSIQANGHVHVVLLRRGNTPTDFDRFAATLVHEGSHAFVHRLYTTTLIPHWVNEGLAELTVERVLGDRSTAGETADLLARCYVRYDWPAAHLLGSDAPIAVEQYPLAHSIVAYLNRRDPERFRGFIRALKSGQTTGNALAEQFDGLTLDTLDVDWRTDVRARQPADSATGQAATRN